MCYVWAHYGYGKGSIKVCLIAYLIMTIRPFQNVIFYYYYYCCCCYFRKDVISGFVKLGKNGNRVKGSKGQMWRYGCRFGEQWWKRANNDMTVHGQNVMEVVGADWESFVMIKERRDLKFGGLVALVSRLVAHRWW